MGTSARDKRENSANMAGRAAADAAPDYGALLWGADGAQASVMLPYVQEHADRMIARVRTEDPRAHYVALKHVHDVCLYKRVAGPQGPSARPAPSPTSSSLSSSFSSASASSRRGPHPRVPFATSASAHLQSDPDTGTSHGGHIPGHFDFRGATRVPGCLDDVMALLAPESPRETFWVARNTHKDLRAATLLSSARLPDLRAPAGAVDAAATATFPRWSRKYEAARLTKHGGRLVDSCYAEYATTATDSDAQGQTRRRGFVYRRSVSEAALSRSGSASAEALARTRVPNCARLCVRDWLFEVTETSEPLVCTLVLICSVYFPHPSPGRVRAEFREFCTELLVGVRRVLTGQGRRTAALAGVRGGSAWRRGPLGCGVCSAPLSLLRKRHECGGCGVVVCSKCWTKRAATATIQADGARSGAGSAAVTTASVAQTGRSQCVLCAQFGSDGGSELLTSASFRGSVRRQVSSSRGIGMPARSSRPPEVEVDQEDHDEVHPELELRTTTSVASGSSRHRSLRSLGSQRNVGELEEEENEEEEEEEEVRPFTPRLDLRPSAKLRTTSTDSISSTRSAPGIMLLSELETLSLSGSFRRLPAASAASPAAAPTAAPTSKRPDRAVSEDNVLLTSTASVQDAAQASSKPQESSASTEEDEDVYSEDDLANFTLGLL
ncbi:hypothetical protein BBJ28_00012942 [Nothophytophthora sp. Chile5]|nr:hypothetical protein BBJ28_00012942 [Nothophytophthora sp. Chile5]